MTDRDYLPGTDEWYEARGLSKPNTKTQQHSSKQIHFATPEIEAFINDNLIWAKSMFKSNAMSCMKHLKKEIQEVITELEVEEENGSEAAALLEFADCYLLLMQAALHRGHKFSDVHRAAINKMAINRKRKWGEKNADGFVEHEK